MTQSFGVFQQYYENELLPNESAMAISWVGAVNAALCPMLGCFSGPLFDAGYLKYLTAGGGLLYMFGLCMASISKQYYQVLLSHGFCVGIGMGTMFSPSVAVLSQHFARSRHRNLVFGLQACGSAVAGIYLPIMLNYIMPAIGFAWSMRVCELPQEGERRRRANAKWHSTSSFARPSRSSRSRRPSRHGRSWLSSAPPCTRTRGTACT